MEQQYKTDAEIYAVLEREIIDLTIRPGSSLSENPLCARFGAPRSLIRVVLQKLQENGLVRIVPYKGTTVTRLNRRIVDELIYERTAVLRCEPAKLDELLHPVFDKKAIANAQVITKGLPASPGAATGPVVFFAEDAEKILAESGQKAILVRIETSPEDLKGMLDAAGILTARGGMTSHAAVVARGMGKCCVSGAGELEIDYKTSTIRVNGFTVKEGDWISLNGSTGEVYLGQVATMAADLSGDFGQLMAVSYTHLRAHET